MCVCVCSTVLQSAAKKGKLIGGDESALGLMDAPQQLMLGDADQAPAPRHTRPADDDEILYVSVDGDDAPSGACVCVYVCMRARACV